MVYIIRKDGEDINSIVAADEAFVRDYCAAHGYTYELDERPEPVPEEDPTDPSVWDELDAAYREGVDSI